MPDGNDKNKVKKDRAYYLKKYGTYMGGGRETDKDLADRVLPDSKKPYKQIVMEQAKKLGIKPEILFASLNEEGVRDQAKNLEYSGDNKYRVAGYAHFGLDTFGDSAQLLKDKGYLPKDFDFSPVLGENEKGQKVHTANFKSVEDAVAAKAAMMKDISDDVTSWATRKGYKLTDKSKDFFMLAGYNAGVKDDKGGIGNMQKMMDSFNAKGLLQDDKYLTSKPASYGGVYDNVMKRIVPAQAWADDGLFVEPAPVITPNTATTTPILPVVAPVNNAAYIKPKPKNVNDASL